MIPFEFIFMVIFPMRFMVELIVFCSERSAHMWYKSGLLLIHYSKYEMVRFYTGIKFDKNICIYDLIIQK